MVGTRFVRAFGGVRLGRDAAAALLKIEAVLPPELRERSRAHAHLRAAKWTALENSGLIDDLHAAVTSAQVLRMRYRDGEARTSEREIEPLCLAFWGGSWTLGAWCRLRGDFRNFRPDRIVDSATGELLDTRAAWMPTCVRPMRRPATRVDARARRCATCNAEGSDGRADAAPCRRARAPRSRNALFGSRDEAGAIAGYPSDHRLEHPMIDLYYWATPNGLKLKLFMEETRLPHRIVPVDIGAGEQFQPEFLAISPNNRIPALVDHDPPGGGAPLSLFESGAMLLYLAEKTGRFLPTDPRGRAEVLQWLFWQVGGLGPMAGQNGHFNVYAPEKVPYAIDRYTRETARLYGVLDRRLADRDYIAGDEYTIADIACYPWIVPHAAHGQDLDDFRHLQRWFERVRAGRRCGAPTSASTIRTRRRRRRCRMRSARCCSGRPCRSLAATARDHRFAAPGVRSPAG